MRSVAQLFTRWTRSTRQPLDLQRGTTMLRLVHPASVCINSPLTTPVGMIFWCASCVRAPLSVYFNQYPVDTATTAHKSWDNGECRGGWTNRGGSKYSIVVYRRRHPPPSSPVPSMCARTPSATTMGDPTMRARSSLSFLRKFPGIYCEISRESKIVSRHTSFRPSRNWSSTAACLAARPWFCGTYRYFRDSEGTRDEEAWNVDGLGSLG